MIKSRSIRIAVVTAAVAALFALAAPSFASTPGAAGDTKATIAAPLSGSTHAQVTVDPNAPKRQYSETEDTPWTLWLPKVLAPAVLLLLFFVLVWYIWRMARLRSASS